MYLEEEPVGLFDGLTAGGREREENTRMSSEIAPGIGAPCSAGPAGRARVGMP